MMLKKTRASIGLIGDLLISWELLICCHVKGCKILHILILISSNCWERGLCRSGLPTCQKLGPMVYYLISRLRLLLANKSTSFCHGLTSAVRQIPWDELSHLQTQELQSIFFCKILIHIYVTDKFPQRGLHTALLFMCWLCMSIKMGVKT